MEKVKSKIVVQANYFSSKLQSDAKDIRALIEWKWILC